jgi:hypothetical protein
MRTTLTIEDDLAMKLKAEVRRTGKPFKTVVNEYLRSGLLQRQVRKPQERFRVSARSLGALRPGISLQNVGELLELIESPQHR